MQWTDFLGHETQINWFRTAVLQGRLASTFLLTGPSGIGKRTFARLVAKSLLCPHASNFTPCGKCESCVQVDADSNPDVLQLAKPPEKSTIPLELLVGDRETRLREGLCYEISLKPFGGLRRVAIIDDADFLAVEGANSLLKTLEEPPPRAVIFLISTSEQRQLPTIRSRCQVIRFQPLSNDNLAKLLLRHNWVTDESIAREFAEFAEGSLGNVRFLQDEDFRAFRNELRRRLSETPLQFMDLAKSIVASVDSVGADGAEKRDRLRVIIKEMTYFYRQALYEFNQPNTAGSLTGGMTKQDDFVMQAAKRWPNPTHIAVRAMQRCLDASSQVERFMGTAMIVESLCVELTEICRA
jgi:DNA polymerase III subunit delta'